MAINLQHKIWGINSVCSYALNAIMHYYFIKLSHLFYSCNIVVKSLRGHLILLVSLKISNSGSAVSSVVLVTGETVSGRELSLGFSFDTLFRSIFGMSCLDVVNISFYYTSIGQHYSVGYWTGDSLNGTRNQSTTVWMQWNPVHTLIHLQWTL